MTKRILALAVVLTVLGGVPGAEAKPRKAKTGLYKGKLGKQRMTLTLDSREVYSMGGAVPVTCPKRPELKYIAFGYGFVDNGGKPVRINKKGKFSTSAVRPLADDVRVTMSGRVSRNGKAVSGKFKIEYNAKAGDKEGCVSPLLSYKVRFKKKVDPLIYG